MDKVILAAIALVSGAIGSLFAPWANWGIEKRKQKLEYRKELIKRWRAMLAELAAQEIGTDDAKPLALLEKHEDFYSLSNHIDSDSNPYGEYRKRKASLNTPVFLRYLAHEISRIEKEWDLI